MYALLMMPLLLWFSKSGEDGEDVDVRIGTGWTSRLWKRACIHVFGRFPVGDAYASDSVLVSGDRESVGEVRSGKGLREGKGSGILHIGYDGVFCSLDRGGWSDGEGNVT